MPMAFHRWSCSTGSSVYRTTADSNGLRVCIGFPDQLRTAFFLSVAASVKAVAHFYAKDDAWSFEVDFIDPENAAPISSASDPSVRGGTAPGAPCRRWWTFWN